LVLNFTEDDFKLTGTDPAIIFTLANDTEGLTTSEIESAGVCKLIYTRADQGERPDITISGCTE